MSNLRRLEKVPQAWRQVTSLSECIPLSNEIGISGTTPLVMRSRVGSLQRVEGWEGLDRVLVVPHVHWYKKLLSRTVSGL